MRFPEECDYINGTCIEQDESEVKSQQTGMRISFAYRSNQHRQDVTNPSHLSLTLPTGNTPGIYPLLFIPNYYIIQYINPPTQYNIHSLSLFPYFQLTYFLFIPPYQYHQLSMYEPTQAEINLFIHLIRTEVGGPRKESGAKKQEDALLRVIKNRYQDRKLSESIDQEIIKLPAPRPVKATKRTFYQLYEEQMVRKHESKKKNWDTEISKTQMLSLRNMNSIDVSLDRDQREPPKLARKYYRSEQVTPRQQIEAKKKYFLNKKKGLKTESEYLRGVKKELYDRLEVDSESRRKTDPRMSEISLTKVTKVPKFRVRYSKEYSTLDKKYTDGLLPPSKRRDLTIDPWVTIDQYQDI